MINAQENGNADITMSKCIRNIPRANSDVICELSDERRGISWRLERLNNAITADPEAVSAHHKELWEYIFGKKKESQKARCCECGTECDKSMMAWVGEGVYKCRLCLLMRRNDG